MNKWLLVWNIVLTVLVAAVLLGSCSSNEEYLTQRLQTDEVAIAQLKAQVDQQASQIASLQTSTQTALSQLSTSLQQFVQQYVQAYVAANK